MWRTLTEWGLAYADVAKEGPHFHISDAGQSWLQTIFLGLVVAAVGYMIKRWIEQTGEEIKGLREGKRNSEECNAIRTGCISTVRAEIGAVHVEISGLTKTVTLLRQEWSASITERNNLFLEMRKDMKDLQRAVWNRNENHTQD